MTEQASWMRVRVTRGASGEREWSLRGGEPRRILVGTALDAGWRIDAPGVTPVHLELYWDGQALWVTQAGRTQVDMNGCPVVGWSQVLNGSEVAFGSAALAVETSAPISNEMATDPRLALPASVGAAGRSSGTDMPHGSVPLTWDDSSLVGDATRVVAPVEDWSEIQGDRTRIAPEMAAGPSFAGDSKPHEVIRPRLGAAARPSFGVPGEDPGQATMMRPALEPARMNGGPVPMNGGPVPMNGASMNAPAMIAAPMAAPLQNTANGGISPSGAGPGNGMPPPSYPPSAPVPSNGFIAPPTFDQAAEAKKTNGSSIPLRTWALLGVTLAVAGLALLLPPGGGAAPQPAAEAAGAVAIGGGADSTPDAQAAANVGGSNPSASGGTAPAEPAPLQAPVAANPAPSASVQAATAFQAAPTTQPAASTVRAEPNTLQAAPPVERQVVDSASPEPLQAGSEAEQAAPVEPRTLGPTGERAAADLLIAGHLEEALSRYAALAEAYPQRTEYPTLVRILRRRIRDLCRDGTTPSGQPCGAMR